jgi:amino acid transporter
MGERKLQRSLDYLDGMGVIISIMIGSGIFASPGIVLKHAGSPISVLIAWFLSGIIVMITSLCYTELGSRYPSAGGDYEYLTRAYGKPIGFSFIWYYFWISKPGSQAIIATVFGDYLLHAITGRSSSNGDGSSISKLFSVSLILLLTLINCLGVKESSTVINVLTIFKLLLIVFVAISGFVFAVQNYSIVRENFVSFHPSSESSPPSLTFLSSLIPCLWAYEGWADLNFLLEELKNPMNSRSLSCLVWQSIGVVMVCYLFANLAYFAVLPAESIMNTTTVGLDFGQRIHRVAGVVMTVGIMFSTVGSAHGSILTGRHFNHQLESLFSSPTGGRAFYAVARDGQAPRALALLNSRGEICRCLSLIQHRCSLCFPPRSSHLDDCSPSLARLKLLFPPLILWTIFMVLLRTHWHIPSCASITSSQRPNLLDLPPSSLSHRHINCSCDRQLRQLPSLLFHCLWFHFLFAPRVVDLSSLGFH